MRGSRIRVFLADDHPLVREGIKRLVESQPDMEVVGEAADGVSACEEVLRLLPDIVVMDISMPRLHGAHATVRIRKSCPKVKVITLTVNEDRAFLRELLDAGASGYVVKRAAAGDLIRAIRIVHAGDMYVDPAITREVITGPRQPDPVRGATKLTKREEQVLRLVANGHLNKEVADLLRISVKTVETHRSRGCTKLGFAGRAAIVRYAKHKGWLVEDGKDTGDTDGLRASRTEQERARSPSSPAGAAGEQVHPLTGPLTDG